MKSTIEKVNRVYSQKNLESIIIHNYRDVIGKYGKIYLSFLKELKKK